MLDVRDIHTYYGNSYILQGVSLTLEPNRVTGLLGRNGVGKSTLVRSILGLTPARRGEVEMDGEALTRLPTHGIVQRGVGWVPQERRIFPSLTVEENLRINGRSSSANGACRWDLEKIYALFPILEERADSRGTLLSGGEQQMLAVARALMGNPRYLLMDEPSEGLAPLIVRDLGRIIDRLKGEGMGILLVEQNLHFALAHTDSVYVMNKGRVVRQLSPEELREDRELQKTYLGV
ncbi:MAG: ABC transporter ATP-binding protein [Deferrisomatales bacterium]|nr:ABC transporter ATP-binding protein [Deferrisomatales bacterium]